MKILLYGDTRPGSGGWCYEKTLQNLGHEVRTFSENMALEVYQTSLLRKILRKLNASVFEIDRRRHSGHLISEARRFRPSIVIVQKGLFLSREDILAIKRNESWVCNINHDDFFSYNRNNWSRIQRSAVPAYDHIFVTRAVNVAEVRPLNPNIDYFPFSYYPEIHKPTQIPQSEADRWKTDLVFVGTHEASRAEAMEKLLHLGKYHLSMYGSGWRRLKKTSVLRQCVRGGEIRFDELCKALGGAKICLGFLRKENRDEYTQRSFEIPACRGLLLAERTPTHTKLYREGSEAEFFNVNDPTELNRKVAELLANPYRRDAMVEAGYQALINGKHTYADRLSNLFSIYQKRAINISALNIYT